MTFSSDFLFIVRYFIFSYFGANLGPTCLPTWTQTWTDENGKQLLISFLIVMRRTVCNLLLCVVCRFFCFCWLVAGCCSARRNLADYEKWNVEVFLENRLDFYWDAIGREADLMIL